MPNSVSETSVSVLTETSERSVVLDDTIVTFCSVGTESLDITAYTVYTVFSNLRM